MLHDDARSDVNALLPGRATEAGATRRTALQVAMGLGYAAAAAPLMAQTAIATPADGLDAGEVSFTVGGFRVPAYRAAPAGKTGLPVVLVIQEIFGVHEYIADTCRRFAKAGYLAIAPELYARQGDPAMYGEMAKLMAEVVSKVPDAQVMADLDGAEVNGVRRGSHHGLAGGGQGRQQSGGQGGAQASSGKRQRHSKDSFGCRTYVPYEYMDNDGGGISNRSKANVPHCGPTGALARAQQSESWGWAPVSRCPPAAPLRQTCPALAPANACGRALSLAAVLVYQRGTGSSLSCSRRSA